MVHSHFFRNGPSKWVLSFFFALQSVHQDTSVKLSNVTFWWLSFFTFVREYVLVLGRLCKEIPNTAKIGENSKTKTFFETVEQKECNDKWYRLLLVKRKKTKLLVVGELLLGELENGSMTRSLVPSCGSLWVRWLLVDAYSAVHASFGKTANSCSRLWTTGMKVCLRQSAPTYLVLANIQYKPEPLPQTSIFYCTLALARAAPHTWYMAQSMWSSSPRPLPSTVF